MSSAPTVPIPCHPARPAWTPQPSWGVDGSAGDPAVDGPPRRGAHRSARFAPAARRWLQAGVVLLGLLLVRPAWAQSAVTPASMDGPPRVIVDLPTGGGPFPALVLAPGQGYHMGLPAMVSTAQALSAQGVAVFRFDWSYTSAVPRGQPSADLVRELQDLQAVLAMARSHPRVRADQVFAGGKSLGSIVAWRALAADPHLRGAVLLTPVCSRLRPGESTARSLGRENYPGLAGERRPSLWISGDRDPLCAVQALYAFAQESEHVRVGIVGGDHAFEHRELPPDAAAVQLGRNLAAAAALSTTFLADTLARRP